MIGSMKSFVLAFMELVQDICTILVTTLRFAGKGWGLDGEGPGRSEGGNWHFC